ncbi:uncharacterized protein K452DRAFT_229056 [Aplosporella prunicola CBS 121167]|uniref:Phosphoribulokinase/uridine kinase domain-containing protein n=1 Tax=Aplosporella prunicola CBS 121167 TaxID=1176127 RepID=A0A6A6BAQ7_9PEZI|nr:uncharacterized protein K452DRAFT_229056 [Aplosporella prunicola CBS 121167]KAF2141180.1 hypothetical protein K452DRAFT_229056 [Aplosporella prunicola CBS 121167]
MPPSSADAARLATLSPPNPSFPLTSAALLIALSGPSSSGKTTLARLLRDALPASYILHEDDFYKTDVDIPRRADGVQDWDCLDAIDAPALRAALAHIRDAGTPPPDFVSKEDQNAVGECGVDSAAIERAADRLRSFFARPDVREHWAERRIALIDGFLLYSKEMAELGVRDAFDIKLFLRTSHQTAKQRREARSGYVTLEGFWEDPPGYVDDIVWPNYVKDHEFLFKDGNVEGELDEDVCRKIGIQGMPKEAEGNMSVCLEWATGVIIEKLSEQLGVGTDA